MFTDPVCLAELVVILVFGTLIVWRCLPSYRRRQLRREARARIDVRRALYGHDTVDGRDRQA